MQGTTSIKHLTFKNWRIILETFNLVQIIQEKKLFSTQKSTSEFQTKNTYLPEKNRDSSHHIIQIGRCVWRRVPWFGTA
jgi:hypothetical protein